MFKEFKDLGKPFVFFALIGSLAEIMFSVGTNFWGIMAGIATGALAMSMGVLWKTKDNEAMAGIAFYTCFLLIALICFEMFSLGGWMQGLFRFSWFFIFVLWRIAGIVNLDFLEQW